MALAGNHTDATLEAATEDMEAETALSVPVLLAFAGLSAIGVPANALALSRVAKNFGLDGAVFSLIFVDAASSLAGCACHALSALAAAFVSRDEFTCAVLAASMYIPNIFGGIAISQVAIIRYFAICKGRRNKVIDEKLAKRGSLCVFAAYTFVYLSILFTTRSRGELFTQLANLCAAGPGVATVHHLLRVFFVVPIIVLSCVSLTFDALTARLVRRDVADCNGGSKDDPFTMPVKATAFSAMTAVVYLVVAAVDGAVGRSSPLHKTTAITFVGVSVNVVRCSVATRMTLVSKGKKEKEADREKRRKREAEYAASRREEHRKDEENGGRDVHLEAVLNITRKELQQHSPSSAV